MGTQPCLASLLAKFYLGEMMWAFLHAFIWSLVRDPWRIFGQCQVLSAFWPGSPQWYKTGVLSD
jgi:hypothetical protein